MFCRPSQIVFGWIVILATAQGGASAADDTLDDVRSSLRSYLADYRNAFHVSLSEVQKNDEERPTWWNQVKYHHDALGRMRMEMTDGDYDDRGNRIVNRRELFLYNGEITARYDYGYDRLLGNFQKTGKDTWICLKEGREGVFGTNSPFKMYETALQRTCEHAEKMNQAIRITRSKENPDVCIVEANLRWEADEKRPKALAVRHQYHVDMKVGVITRVESSNADGIQKDLSEIKYVDHAGIVFPSESSVECVQLISRPGKAATMERFHVTMKYFDFKYNDPEFPKDVFDIVLPEGAYVWDTRCRKEYRIRTEDVILAPEQKSPVK